MASPDGGESEQDFTPEDLEGVLEGAPVATSSCAPGATSSGVGRSSPTANACSAETAPTQRDTEGSLSVGRRCRADTSPPRARPAEGHASDKPSSKSTTAFVPPNPFSSYPGASSSLNHRPSSPR